MQTLTFGTGYSCLSYLSRYPINKIKIDRSFVRDVASDAAAREIVSAILALGKALDLDVVAEGIESDAQFEALRRQGCRYGQGYLVSKPLPADDFVAFWHKAPEAPKALRVLEAV